MIDRSGISKILIANRSEIAIRIMRTAREMGIATVAIYADGDERGLFLSHADESVALDGVLPREGYLDGEKIVRIAKEVGADAIHPGYGFLSENADFADLVRKSGIHFIGPSTESIRMMGDKISAKAIAEKSGSSIVPGFVGEIKGKKHLHDVAKSIGYPVIMKAAAGGGGKGMRVVYKAEDLDSAFENCVSEAGKNFKDERIFVEKYIVEPRHIEIQVLGDRSGNIVCLGERECSIQRFNQKIIEEAPSTFVNDELRERMYDDATKLAKACNYYSAGTVEYIVGKDGSFYFLEMNTRLQVEHAVTEIVTGFDLVEQMIKIENGDSLGFTQKDVKLNGWAIECRICAEDPANGFIASSGRITDYHEPSSGRNIRVESGYRKGGNISPYYDSMIAKLISSGDVRNEAIAHMKSALGGYIIDGIATNLFMLEVIMRNSKFERGDISTSFISNEYQNCKVMIGVTYETVCYFVCAAIVVQKIRAERPITYGDNTTTVQDNINMPQPGKYCVVIGKNNYVVQVRNNDTDQCSMLVNIGGSSDVRFHYHYENGGRFVRLFDMSREIQDMIVKIDYLSGSKFIMSANGSEATLFVCPVHVMPFLQYVIDKEFQDEPNDKVLTQISGLVTNVAVKVGQDIKHGEALLCIEAMKMENVISSERDGIVKSILVKPGDAVGSGDVLIEFAD